MNSVYFDNAATTKMLPEVIEVMRQSMIDNYGNPSSIHQFGRKAKSAIETARKNIAKHFNVSASEIIFTSSGTEANNLVLQNAVVNLGVERIVTSRIEHHAVLKVVEYLQNTYNIKVEYLDIDEFGVVDLFHLERLLSSGSSKTLVSLMMVNNEIGNLLPIKVVSELCKKYKSLFHSDTVQAIGQYRLDLEEVPVDFIVASAHKFHGPKGVGFLYVKKGVLVKPMFFGGGQEKGVRSGTENVHAILGMDKALSIAYENLEKDNLHKMELKKYFIKKLQGLGKGVEFNGRSSDLENSTAKILNVRFDVKNSMFLFNLDLMGVVASGGSACQSGASKGSHVLQSFLNSNDLDKVSIRFSFSKCSEKKEIDFAVDKFKVLL